MRMKNKMFDMIIDVDPIQDALFYDLVYEGDNPSADAEIIVEMDDEDYE
jgi:hypothetical protein